jgi:hypothetical protein
MFLTDDLTFEMWTSQEYKKEYVHMSDKANDLEKHSE